MTKAPPFSHKSRSESFAKGRGNTSCDQGDLFQRLEIEPAASADLDIHYELLGAVTACLRETRNRGISREEVVERMNRLLPECRPDGKSAVTKRQLDCWTAHSKEYSEFPARFLPAFCAAVESPLPILVLAQAIGRELVDAREAQAKRLGEAQIDAARLKREARRLINELGGE
jgi:hypothetical protein